MGLSQLRLEMLHLWLVRPMLIAEMDVVEMRDALGVTIMDFLYLALNGQII